MPATPSLNWYKPRSCWSIRVRGRRHYFPKGTTKPEAEALARSLLLRSGYQPTKLTLRQLMEAWADERRPRMARSTVAKDARMIQSLGTLGTSCPSSVEPLAVRLWVVRNAEGRKRSTANQQLQMFKLGLRWGVERGLVDWQTCYKVEKVRPLQPGEGGGESAAKRPPSGDDLRKIRDNLPEPHRGLLDLLTLTGARVGEIIRADLSEIDRSALPWVYKPAQHKTAKKGKDRWIYFGPQARAVLVRLGEQGPVYPLTYTGFWQAIQAACRRAGVDPISPHQLRHLAATRLRLEHGSEAARLVLGHSDKQMTDHYSWTAQHQAGAVVEASG